MFFPSFSPMARSVYRCHRELVSSHLNLNTKNWLHIQKHYSAFLGTTPLTEVSSKKRLAALIRPGRTTDQWPLEPPFVGWFQGRTQDIYTCLKLHLQLAELRLLHPQVIEILSALPHGSPRYEVLDLTLPSTRFVLMDILIIPGPLFEMLKFLTAGYITKVVVLMNRKSAYHQLLHPRSKISMRLEVDSKPKTKHIHLAKLL